MPSEVRQLLFRSREIILAVTEYYYRRGLALPVGTAARVSIIDDQGVGALLGIDADTGESVEIPIPGDTLLAALILYCINRKIPLPVEADKTLRRVQDDAVALVIVKHTKASP
jgi:hypothetical protein